MFFVTRNHLFQGGFMKKLLIVFVAVFAVAGLSGCTEIGKGKGKAPVETNG